LPAYTGTYRAVCWGPDNSLLAVTVNPFTLRVFNGQGKKLYQFSSQQLKLNENEEEPFDCDGMTWEAGHLLLALYPKYRGGGECKLYSYKLTVEDTTQQIQDIHESSTPCKY